MPFRSTCNTFDVYRMNKKHTSDLEDAGLPVEIQLEGAAFSFHPEPSKSGKPAFATTPDCPGQKYRSLTPSNNVERYQGPNTSTARSPKFDNLSSRAARARLHTYHPFSPKGPNKHFRNELEPAGIDPATSRMLSERSTI